MVQTGTRLGIEIEDGKAYDEGVEKLRKKHSKAVKEQEEKDKDFEKYLEEPAEVKIHTIPESLVPENISAGHLRGIFELIA